MKNKYDALKNTTNWIINSSSEEFISTFKMLDGNYSGITVGEFIDSFFDHSDNNFFEYELITTGNFIFGAEEIISNNKKEWTPINITEKAGVKGVELIDIKNINLINTEQKCTDLYDAANDCIYYSLAA